MPRRYTLFVLLNIAVIGLLATLALTWDALAILVIILAIQSVINLAIHANFKKGQLGVSRQLAELDNYVKFQRKRASTKEYEILRDTAAIRRSLDALMTRISVDQTQRSELKTQLIAYESDLNSMSDRVRALSSEVGALLDLAILDSVERGAQSSERTGAWS